MSRDIIRFSNGRKVQAEFMDSGCFTSALRGVKNRKRVFLLTKLDEDGTPRDRSKEVLAYARNLRKNKHLPVLKHRGIVRWFEGQHNNGEYDCYETVYSSSLDYDLPESVSSLAYAEDSNKVRASMRSMSVPQSVKNALEDIFEACSVYGLSEDDCTDIEETPSQSFRFDLHNGNFGMKADGTVLLRDPLVVHF